MLFTSFYLNNHSKPQTGKYKVFRFEVTLNPLLLFIFLQSSVIKNRSILISSPCRFHFVLYYFIRFFGRRCRFGRCKADIHQMSCTLVFALIRVRKYNIRESAPAGLRLLGQYIYYDALVVHGSGDKLEGYGGKQNE